MASRGYRCGVDDDRVAFQHKPGRGVGCPGKYSGYMDRRILICYLHARMDPRVYDRISIEFYCAASFHADGLCHAILSLRVTGETDSARD